MGKKPQNWIKGFLALGAKVVRWQQQSLVGAFRHPGGASSRRTIVIFLYCTMATLCSVLMPRTLWQPQRLGYFLLAKSSLGLKPIEAMLQSESTAATVERGQRQQQQNTAKGFIYIANRAVQKLVLEVQGRCCYCP